MLLHQLIDGEGRCAALGQLLFRLVAETCSGNGHFLGESAISQDLARNDKGLTLLRLLLQLPEIDNTSLPCWLLQIGRDALPERAFLLDSKTLQLGNQRCRLVVLHFSLLARKPMRTSSLLNGVRGPQL
jgi:hypothetical protein